jgi:two-component system NtrC family sensor kinase
VVERVLDRGETWTGPAFVVNDWYIAAYEPITDPRGRIIGVLYVGLLQAPFARRHLLLVGGFLALVLLATVASLLLIFLVTKLVLRPIGHIIAMQRKVAAGDLTARVGIAASGEMGELCREIDRMADALQERERQLEQATSRQIGRSEQLASIGRLAAGVAHEINNPLTGVLTFACMLRDKENMDPQDRQDLDLIIRETTRAAGIVRGLLDFARERPSAKAPMNINDVIRQTVRLLGNQSAFHNIVVVEDLADELPAIDGDANQIQQVFLNLSLNACEAMPDGGTLLLSTSCEDQSVVVRVTDTGCGIKPEHLDQIFEPFFTTKPVGKGTGLGLSVSYGIVRQHGGTLEVESVEGKGSTFLVTLPALGNALPGGPGTGPIRPLTSGPHNRLSR